MKTKRAQRKSKKDFYQRMLDAKKAKAEKAKPKLNIDEAPKVKPVLPDTPKPKLDTPIDVTAPTYSSKMDESTSSSAALEKALNRIRDQARNI